MVFIPARKAKSHQTIVLMFRGMIFYLYVIVCKSIINATTAGVFQQHGTTLSQIAFVEGTKLLIADSQQALTPLVFLLRTDNMRNTKGCSAWTFAVAKDMKL